MNADAPGSVVVTWNAVDGASRYRVGWLNHQDYINAGDNWLQRFTFADVPHPQRFYLITRMTPGEEYWFIVASVDASNQMYWPQTWIPKFAVTAAPEPTPCPVCAGAPAGPTARTPDQPISASQATGRYTQISAGKNHTCGVQQDGTVDCWGANGRGQSSPPDGEFLQVSAGGAHTCGVKADSTVVCWGSSAVPSPPANQKFAQISSGNAHSCGITVGSENNPAKVACWGAPGLNRTDDYDNSTVTSVSSGDDHNCSLGVAESIRRQAGTIYCWGGRYHPRRSLEIDNIAIAAGGDHVCWIRGNGEVSCNGDDTSGQVTVPAPSAGAFDQDPYTYTALTAGTAHTCAIDSDGNDAQTRGAARCWGSNLEGQSTPPSGIFTAITAGGAHTCGLRSNGTVECWGDNTYGQAPR